MAYRIAVVGLGQMGGAIAQRLHDRHENVIGYDISANARGQLSKAGVPVADDLKTALSGRNVVLMSLPNPATVRAACLGDEGVIALAEPESLCIELSTIDPATMRDVAQAAHARNLQIIDCPVSGSPNEARQGKLVLIAGGKKEVVERAEPLLLQLGETWRYSGDVGTAKVVKIVNNMMAMGNVLIASEAFALGTAAGIDPDVLYDIISVSGGRSHHFTKRFPNALKGDFTPGFKMELGEKDLALGIELGRTVHMPTPAGSMVREMFSVALASGFRGQDIVALLAMYQQWQAPA